MTQYGFEVHAEDMGGAGHRNIIFELWSGDVWVRRPREMLQMPKIDVLVVDDSAVVRQVICPDS